MTRPASSHSSCELTRDERIALLDLAEAAIEHGVQTDALIDLEAHEVEGPWARRQATFVTVYLDEALNGCIGSIEPVRPLAEDIVHNAFQAAFRDPRFEPISRSDLAALECQISVLSPLELLVAADERALCAAVEPGVHGVLLECRGQRGTLLPSVWEKCADPALFVRHVKRKAGLPADFWAEDLRAYVYTVEQFDRASM